MWREASQLRANKWIDLRGADLTSATQDGALSIIQMHGPEIKTDEGSPIDSEECRSFSAALMAPLICSLREKPWVFNSSIYLFYWLMNPGPGQVDKNGLCLCASCLMGCRPLRIFFLFTGYRNWSQNRKKIASFQSAVWPQFGWVCVAVGISLLHIQRFQHLSRFKLST